MFQFLYLCSYCKHMYVHSWLTDHSVKSRTIKVIKYNSNNSRTTLVCFLSVHTSRKILFMSTCYRYFICFSKYQTVLLETKFLSQIIFHMMSSQLARYHNFLENYYVYTIPLRKLNFAPIIKNNTVKILVPVNTIPGHFSRSMYTGNCERIKIH